MIKSRINGERGPLLLLGLSHKNLERLKAGEPIHFSLEPFGMEGEVLLFAGHTEASMIGDLKQHGLLEAKAADTMLRAMEEDAQQRKAQP